MDDFEVIEKWMCEIVDVNLFFECEVWDCDEVIVKFKEMGEFFKVELIEDLLAGELIIIYCQGDWFDLCCGFYLLFMGKIGKVFKLMKVVGVYWCGDYCNVQL